MKAADRSVSETGAGTMMGIVKLACVSAVLAAALVTATEGSKLAPVADLTQRSVAEPAAPARFAPAAERCGEAAWPYVTQACLGSEPEPSPRVVRHAGSDRLARTGAAFVQAAATGTTVR